MSVDVTQCVHRGGMSDTPTGCNENMRAAQWLPPRFMRSAVRWCEVFMFSPR
jgi:hypothetical protein